METTPKPDWWIEVERRLAMVTPADLPAPPWTLKHTAPGRAMPVLGGRFVTVHGNEAFLAVLRKDVSEGPTGPRGQVVMGDLRALRKAIGEKEGAGAKQSA